jgi:hypothetical protein
MNTESLSINLATVRQQWNLREAVEACARHGIGAIDPWRDQVAALGLAESARVIIHSTARAGMQDANRDRAAPPNVRSRSRLY